MRSDSLAIENPLDGQRIAYPQSAGINRTYKAAPRALKRVAEHPTLFDK
jgi:hypothetical protein